MSRYRAAVFDLDGTLIDSYAAIHESLNVVLKRLGREELSSSQVRRLVGRGLRSLMERAAGPQNVEEGVRLFEEVYEELGPELTVLLPGAEELTAELSHRGVPMAVASNKPSIFSEQLLFELGLLARFTVVVGPDDGYPPKPDPAMVRDALEILEVPPGTALFVGDMPIDVETARAAGMDVAAVPTGSSSVEELVAASPDHVVERLLDLLPLFDGCP